MKRAIFLAGIAVGIAAALIASRLLEEEREQCDDCGNTFVHTALRLPA